MKNLLMTLNRANLLILLVFIVIFAFTEGSYAQSRYRISKLIGDLNGSAETNKEARSQLIEMGAVVIPALLEEIAKYKTLSEENLLSAARSLRVLQQINGNSGLDLCREMLVKLDDKTDKLESYQRILLSEALHYISLKAESERHFSLLAKFLLQSPEKTENEKSSIYWKVELEPNSHKAHKQLEAPSFPTGWITPFTERKTGEKIQRWCCSYTTSHTRWMRHTKSSGYTLFIDTYNIVSNMVKRGETEYAEQILIDFLSRHPYQVSLYFEMIGEDDFSAGVYSYSLRKKIEAGEWLDSKLRPRIVAMELLRQLKSKKAIPHLEKLLRSDHKDEREYALLALEEITK